MGIPIESLRLALTYCHKRLMMAALTLFDALSILSSVWKSKRLFIYSWWAFLISLCTSLRSCLNLVQSCSPLVRRMGRFLWNLKGWFLDNGERILDITKRSCVLHQNATKRWMRLVVVVFFCLCIAHAYVWHVYVLMQILKILNHKKNSSIFILRFQHNLSLKKGKHLFWKIEFWQ